MKKSTRKILSFSLIGSFLGLLIPKSLTFAVCPVCTLAVGVGLGFTRELGIDDTVSGLWIGAVVVSMTMWTINWMIKKNYNFKGRGIAILLGYILITIVPLYFLKGIWHPLNVIWGMNRLLLGIILGGFAFYGTERLYDWMKMKNGGHAHFPFEKVVLPLVSLIILSIVFYFITK
ncbi:MAG: hypothetical protein Q7R78_00210 [bacterium]|nr:hypothetical protein [bacterium]